MMFVKPIYYLKIISETDIMCLWDLVHANFGTVGVSIHADGSIYIAEMQLGRNEPSFLKA